MHNQIKYLIAAQRDTDWGLVATTAGDQTIPPHSPYPSADHPPGYNFSTDRGRTLSEYQLVFISSGGGEFASAHCPRTTIGPGTLFLLFPGEWHTYRPDPETGWHESWLGFKGAAIDRLVRTGFFTPAAPLFHPGARGDIHNLFRQGVAAARRQRSGYQQVLAGITHLLLGLAAADERQSGLGTEGLDGIIEQAKLLMEQQIEQSLPCEQIARRVGMGYSRFRKLFRQYTGVSPGEYMQQLRISRSKELLTQTALTCQQIAYQSGFESPSYFNTAFRRATGMTPAQFRSTNKLHPLTSE